MSLTFANLSTDAGLAQLDAYFVARAYVFGTGPSSADLDLLKLVGKCPADKYANAKRWYTHIQQFKNKNFPKFTALTVGVAKAEEKAAAGDDDDSDSDDMFGSDDDDDDSDDDLAAMSAGAKKDPLAPVNRSQIVFEVKPAGIEIDLDDLFEKINKLTLDGRSDGRFNKIIDDWNSPMVSLESSLIWGVACEKVPVAFGLFKLMVSCIVIDDVVGTDDIIEMIEGDFPEEVSSVDTHAMNKASQLKAPKK